MLEIHTSAVTPAHILEVSGHVKKFNDSTVKDHTTGTYHRADHLLEDTMKELLKNPNLSADKISEYRTVLRSADEYSIEELTKILVDYNVKVG